jgi:aminomethyltransferase
VSDNKRTALYEVHRSLGAKLIPFGGWDMPVEYSGIAREHTAVRTGAGLFDVSHMGEFEVRGPQALNLIQFVTTNDASKLSNGQAQYSAMAYPEGTVVDDLLVYRHSQDHFMLVVNAGNIGKDFDWIRSHNRFNASIEDHSDRYTLLSVQGPRCVDVLRPLIEGQFADIPYYHFRRSQILEADAILSRTGYTGEDGFEIYFSPEFSKSIWNAILEAGGSFGLLPAGLGARNTLRLEARMLLYGNDMDPTTTLLEAGLGWIVKLDKGPFIGSEAIAREKAAGVKRKLAGFEMLGREIARDHYAAYFKDQQVGRVTSGSPSITLKKNIGLVYLPAEHAAIGTRFQVSVRGRLCDAQVVPTPFYKRAGTKDGPRLS